GSVLVSVRAGDSGSSSPFGIGFDSPGGIGLDSPGETLSGLSWARAAPGLSDCVQPVRTRGAARVLRLNATKSPGMGISRVRGCGGRRGRLPPEGPTPGGRDDTGKLRNGTR